MPEPAKTKLFVAGLPWETNQNELYELIKPYGKIVEAKIILDRKTGKSKGFGFIEMATAEEAAAALKGLNGFILGGRTLYATEFKEKGERQESPAPFPSAPRPSAPRPAFGPPGGVERRSGRDRRKNPGFGGPSPERREFKKPWEKKPWDKKPWSKDKPGFGERKPWKPWDKEKGGESGGKKPWKPWDKEKRGGFGDKKPWSPKPGGEKPFGKKPFGKKPFGKKPFGRKPGGFRRPG